MIACLDVGYQKERARAACVVLGAWGDERPQATFVADSSGVLPYQPGQFYRRELPCLLAVLKLLPEMPDILVVDGYVWLPPDREPGLGARLYEAVGGLTPVVGIAKTTFRGSANAEFVELVFRGRSRRPLFVTSAGIDPEEAADMVREMHGSHRIPDALKMADRLARSVEQRGIGA